MHQYDQYRNNSQCDPNSASSVQNHCKTNYSITPAIRQAVFVNNKGTKLVQACQFDDAVKSFTAVLKILKPLASLVEANDNYEQIPIPNDEFLPVTPLTFSTFDGFTSLHPVSSDSDNMDTTEPRSPPSPSQMYWEGGISPRPTRRKKQTRVSAAAASKLLAATGPVNKFACQKTSHFVFQNTVEIPPESVPSNLTVNSDGEQSAELFSKFLMIVMYNLALTLHLHALSLSNSTNNPHLGQSCFNANISNNDNDEKKAKKLFLRSRKLYELAFEMHLEESSDVNLLFTLALINNLGLVYDITGQKQRSKTCFKNMFSTMMYLMDSNESHPVKEWDGLLSNVMDILFQQHRKIAAPAA